MFGAALYTIGITSDDPTIRIIGTLAGRLLTADALAPFSAFEAGAIQGFTFSLLSGSDIGQIFTNSVTSALNALITNALPGAMGLGHQEWDLGLALAHSLTQGLFATMSGGEFTSGAAGAFVSKISGAIMKSSIFEDAPQLLKGGMATLFGGLASRAAAGEFEQGAIAALMVWVYNEMGRIYPSKEEMFGRGLSDKELKAFLRMKLAVHMMERSYDANAIRGEYMP